MANLNVDELLSDPDLCDVVIHILRATTVNLRGENIISEEKCETVGSVQPATGRVFNRLPEALRVANLKSFWIKGNIAPQEPGKYPDILIWKGLRYQVQTVQDWSNFGEGYSEGTCVAERPS